MKSAYVLIVALCSNRSISCCLRNTVAVTGYCDSLRKCAVKKTSNELTNIVVTGINHNLELYCIAGLTCNLTGVYDEVVECRTGDP